MSDLEKFGDRFTFYKDYDYKYLTQFCYSQKVEWFECRIKKLLIEPLERILNGEKYIISRLNDEPNCNIMLAMVTLICCGIDMMGSFLEGKNAKHDTFTNFLEKYMNEDYATKSYKNKKYSKILRDDFRNGLAHGLYIKEGSSLEGKDRPYFEEKEDGLAINSWKLFDDFKNGVKKYIEKLKNPEVDSQLREKFEQRFKEVFIK